MNDYAKMIAPDGSTWHMRQENKRKPSYGRQFLIFFTDTMPELYLCDGSTIKVYHWATQHLSHHSWSQFTMAEAGEQIGLSAVSVSRSLRILEEKDFMEKRGTRMRLEWRVTPKGSWLGTAISYQRAMRERGLSNAPVPLELVHSDKQEEEENA